MGGGHRRAAIQAPESGGQLQRFALRGNRFAINSASNRKAMTRRGGGLPQAAKPRIVQAFCPTVACNAKTRFNAGKARRAVPRRLDMYQTVTRNIEVSVTPKFLPERSSQEKSYFFWQYTIEISNHGSETVQLKTRHWRITDAFGRVQEVRGAGVVGEEPVLEPGASYEYTSGVPLPTASGFMVGTYGMVSARGERFDIQIPAFSLDGPEAKRTLN
jgi:ApaG protein